MNSNLEKYINYIVEDLLSNTIYDKELDIVRVPYGGKKMSSYGFILAMSHMTNNSSFMDYISDNFGATSNEFYEIWKRYMTGVTKLLYGK